MKTDEIVVALNVELFNERKKMGSTCEGQFMIRRTIEEVPTFKAYKQYQVQLWYIQDRKKFLILGESITDRVILNDDEFIIKTLNTRFLVAVFQLQKSTSWEKIIKGEYGISDNE